MTHPEDALRDLAAASSSGQEPIFEPEPTRPESPVSKRPGAPPLAERDYAEASANALAQLSGADTEPYDPPQRPTTRKRKPKKPDVAMLGMRTASIPVLITMGLVMSALGAWGVMVKTGNNTLPLADQPNAQQLAIVGLVGLPIAILLFASAGFMFYIVRKDKQKLARWEAAQEEE